MISSTPLARASACRSSDYASTSFSRPAAAARGAPPQRKQPLAAVAAAVAPVASSSNSSNSRTTFVVAASSPAACRNRGGKRSSSRSSSVTFASAASAAASSSSSPSSSSPGDAEEDDEARFAEDYDALTDAIRVTAESLKEKLSGTPIYLVGMMGSGKSTVGKLVGAALRYQFFDTDQLIEAAASAEKEGASVSVADIFASEGEDAFREAETATLQALLPYTSVVVATGGGAVTQRRNWGLMQHGVVCWLDGPAALLASRAAKDGVAKRPLLQQQKAGGGTAEEASTSGGASDAAADDEEELEARLSGLLEKRREQYAIADLRVPLLSSSSPSTGSKGPGGASPALVAFRLLRALERRIDGDAAAREEERKFEITGAGDVPQTMRVVPAKGGASSAGEGGGGAGGKGGKSSGGGGKGFGRKSNNSNGGGGAPAA